MHETFMFKIGVFIKLVSLAQLLGALLLYGFGQDSIIYFCLKVKLNRKTKSVR